MGQQAAAQVKHLVLLRMLRYMYCSLLCCLLPLAMQGVRDRAEIQLQVEEFQEKGYLEDQDQQQYQMLSIPIVILVTNSIDLTFTVNKSCLASNLQAICKQKFQSMP